MPTYNFLLPDIGEGLHEAEIVSWYVNIGDVVKENENIVEVQTDKAVVEISAPVTGKIEKLGGEAGDQVMVGDMLVVFSEVDKVREPDIFQNQGKVTVPLKSADDVQKEKRIAKTRIIAAPSVRKAARETGIDLNDVIPTGRSGKIVAEDLRRYIEKRKSYEELPLEKDNGFMKANKTEVVRTERISGTRKAIFNKMTASKNNVVHCTGMDEVNVTGLVQLRKMLLPHADRQLVKLTYLPFIIKAVSHALNRHPIFNSSIDEEKMEIRYHEPIHIGIATATDDGLVVPVIRNANRKSVLELAKEMEELTMKARNRKLKPSELTGSTFTISNTGSQGGWFATPIINYPEVAILGIHKIKKQPIVNDDKIVIGEMMGMSITFDHRIIDGEPANKFMVDVKGLLEYPELLILEGK